MSIARAVAEYTAGRKIGAKTMFATHYHELTSMEGEVDGVFNCSIAAKKRGDTITFLRKIIPGPTDDSYGIEVAQLAGVPSEVTRKAKQILGKLEEERPIASPGKSELKQPESFNMSFDDIASNQIVDAIKGTDINTLTPIEAMNLIYEWKKLI